TSSDFPGCCRSSSLATASPVARPPRYGRRAARRRRLRRPRRRAGRLSASPSPHQDLRAVAGLRRAGGDRTAARDALAGWELRAALDVVDQQVERALGVRLDQLELREGVLERLDVVAVLHLVQAVLHGAAFAAAALPPVVLVVAHQRLVGP